MESRGYYALKESVNRADMRWCRRWPLSEAGNFCGVCPILNRAIVSIRQRAFVRGRIAVQVFRQFAQKQQGRLASQAFLGEMMKNGAAWSKALPLRKTAVPEAVFLCGYIGANRRLADPEILFFRFFKPDGLKHPGQFPRICLPANHLRRRNHGS